ncbi:MAG TPA: hypothetical protein VFR47_14035 [Anaerolineales bacterium]|nr:hypothetical protein [Anaerolineales bacterium]
MHHEVRGLETSRDASTSWRLGTTPLTTPALAGGARVVPMLFGSAAGLLDHQL